MSHSETPARVLWEPLLRLAPLVLALAVVASAALELQEVHLVTEFALVSAFVLLVTGLGKGAFVLGGLRSADVGHVLAAVALGWVLAAVVSVAGVYVGPPQAPFALVIGLSLIGWGLSIYAHRGEGALRARLAAVLGSREFGIEALLAALVLRIFMAAEGSAYLVTEGARTAVVQYPDMSFHLAIVKAGLFRGLPLDAYPLISGFPRLSYHPAFDTLLTTICRGLHLPVDDAYFFLLLPLTYAVFIFAILAAARAWAGATRAAVIAFALVLVTMLAWPLVPLESQAVLGHFGFVPLRWFLRNPPGALGGALSLLMLAVLSAPRPMDLRRTLLGAVLAGACIAVKAQLALAVGPAFVLVLVVEAIRGRMRWRTVGIGAVTAAVCAGAAYLTTRGAGGPPAIAVGALASYLPRSPSVLREGGIISWLASQVTHPTEEWAFLFFYVLLGLTGWRLVLALLALPAALKSPRNQFRSAAPAWSYSLGLVLMTIVVSLTLVQREDFVFLPWNIAGHTMKLMWPLSVVWAGVILDAALVRLAPTKRPMAPRFLLAPVLALTVIATVMLGSLGAARMRLIKPEPVRNGTARIIRELPRLTSADAVVAQNFSIESQAWVAGYGGRTAYAERLRSPELSRGQSVRRRRVLWRLYRSDDATATARLLEEEQIDYVIVTARQDAEGLRASTRRVAGYGGTELRQAEWSSDAPVKR